MYILKHVSTTYILSTTQSLCFKRYIEYINGDNPISNSFNKKRYVEQGQENYIEFLC